MRKTILALAAGAAFALGGGAYAAECDIAKGEKVFKRCKACHKMEDGANGIGPHLAGIVGRDVAGVADYKYSSALAAYGSGDEVWDADRLGRYLAKPKDEVAGTKMAFAGLKKEQQISDLICYLENPGS